MTDAAAPAAGGRFTIGSDVVASSDPDEYAERYAAVAAARDQAKADRARRIAEDYEAQCAADEAAAAAHEEAAQHIARRDEARKNRDEEYAKAYAASVAADEARAAAREAG